MKNGIRNRQRRRSGEQDKMFINLIHALKYQKLFFLRLKIEAIGKSAIRSNRMHKQKKYNDKSFDSAKISTRAMILTGGVGRLRRQSDGF